MIFGKYVKCVKIYDFMVLKYLYKIDNFIDFTSNIY